MTPVADAVCLSLLITILFVESNALANIAPHRPDPAQIGDMGTSDSGLEVTSETLIIHCDETDQVPYCEFEATYVIHNPNAETRTTVTAFYGVRNSDVSFLIGGVETASRQLNELERVALDHSIEEAASKSYVNRFIKGNGVSRDGFELTVSGGASVRVVSTGRMNPGRTIIPTYNRQAVRARHILLGGKRPGTTYQFVYLIAPIRTWSVMTTIDLTIRYPDHWGFRFSKSAREETQGDGYKVLTATLDPKQDESFNFEADVPWQQLYNGGVLLGFGGNVDDSGGLKARVGYEVAAPEWVLYSLNLETDFVDEFVLAPMAKVASPTTRFFLPFPVIPSFGFGIGLPIRFVPKANVGMRIQSDLMWPLLGIALSVDVFPGLNKADPSFVQAALLGQLAF